MCICSCAYLCVCNHYLFVHMDESFRLWDPSHFHHISIAQVFEFPKSRSHLISLLYITTTRRAKIAFVWFSLIIADSFAEFPVELFSRTEPLYFEELGWRHRSHWGKEWWLPCTSWTSSPPVWKLSPSVALFFEAFRQLFSCALHAKLVSFSHVEGSGDGRKSSWRPGPKWYIKWSEEIEK